MIYILSFVVLLLASLPYGVYAELEIVSQEQTQVVINGTSHIKNTATFLATDQNMEGVPQPYTIRSQDGVDRTVWIKADPPVYVYSQRLIGYVPRYVSVNKDVVCSTTSPINDTEVLRQFLITYGFTTEQAERYAYLTSWHKNKHKHKGYQASFFVWSSDTILGGAGIVLGALGLMRANEAYDLAEADAEQINAIQKNLTAIFNTLAYQQGNISTLFQMQAQFDNQMTNLTVTNNARFRDVTNSIESLEAQSATTDAVVERNRQHIEDVKKQMTDLQNHLETNIDNVEKSLRASIDNGQTENQVVYNLTVKLRQDLNRVVTTIGLLQKQVDGLDQLASIQSRDLGFKRRLIRMYWNSFDNRLYAYPYMKPFLRDIGTRPMATAQRLQLKNAVSSYLLGAAKLLYTAQVTEAGPTLQYYAKEVIIRIKCDTEFAVNNTFKINTPNELYALIGPQVVGADGSLTACDATNPWRCNCVFQVQINQCKLVKQGGPDVPLKPWPYGWNQNSPYRSSILEHPDNKTACVAGTQVAGSNTSYSTELSFNTFLQSTCSGTTYYPEYTMGDRMRITADDSINGADLRLAQLSTNCIGDWRKVALLDNPDIAKTVQYNLNFFLLNSIQIRTKHELPYEEERIYGRLPTDYTLISQPSFVIPGIVATIKCAELYYIYISSHLTEGLLPVYEMKPISTLKKLSISANGVNYTDFSTQQTHPWPYGGGNYSATSNLLLGADAQIFLPSDTYLRVGEYLDFNGQPVDPFKHIYDVPSDLLTRSASMVASEGHITYMLQQTEWGPHVRLNGTFNVSEWQSRYGTIFDPPKAGETAIFYARLPNTDPGVGYRCGGYVAPIVPGWNTTYPAGVKTADYQWCSILNHFVVTQSSDKTLMYLKPRTWQYEGILEVPAGTFIQTVISSCPSNYTITYNSLANTATIRFFTLSNAAVQLRMTIDSDDELCVTENRIIDIDVSDPFTYVLATCGTQYIQLYTIGDAQPCFSGNGLRATLSQVGTTIVPNLPSAFNTRVVAGVSEANVAALSYLQALNSYGAKATNIVLTATDWNTAENQLNALYNNTRATIQQLKPDDTAFNAQWAAIVLQIDIDNNITKANLYQNFLRRQKDNLTDANLEQLNNQADAVAEDVVRLDGRIDVQTVVVANNTRDLLNRIKAFDNMTLLEWHDSDTPWDDVRGFFNDLGSGAVHLVKGAIKDVENLVDSDPLSGLGLGGIFSTIVHVIFYVVIAAVVGLIIFCVPWKKCCKKISSMSKSNDDGGGNHDDDDSSSSKKKEKSNRGDEEEESNGLLDNPKNDRHVLVDYT